MISILPSTLISADDLGEIKVWDLTVPASQISTYNIGESINSLY